MITSPIGFKALFFFFTRFFKSLVNILKDFTLTIKKYFQSEIEHKKDNGIKKSIIYWLISLIIFPLLLVSNLIIHSLVICIYPVIFLFIILNINATISLIISHVTYILVNPSNIFINNTLLVISIIIIYLIVDNEVRMTKKSIYLIDTFKQSSSRIVDMELKMIKDNLSLYQNENLYYLLNNENDSLSVFRTESKIDKLKIDYQNLVKKRENKQLIENQTNIESKDKV